MQEEVQVTQIDDVLRIEYRVAFQDFETGRTEFTDAVAWYDQTELRTSSLTIDPSNNRGFAHGGIQLVDPLGTITGQTLEFDWVGKTGLATDVLIENESIRLEANLLEVLPESWRLFDVQGSLDPSDRPLYSFRAEELEVFPGQRAVLRRATLYVLGVSLGPISEWSFSLDPSDTGSNLPSISRRPGTGVGISWNANWRPSENSLLATGVAFLPRRYPSLNAVYHFWPSNESSGFWRPRSSLEERVADGFFNNVGVTSPDREFSRLAAGNRTFSIGTHWNERTVARVDEAEAVSMPVELSFEQTGQAGTDAAYLASLRAHSIREQARDPFINRLQLSGALVARPQRFGSDVWTTGRIDVFGTVSERGSFGFGRGEVGLLFSPTERASFGVAYVRGEEWGSPDFLFDRLASRNAIHARLDLDFGPYTFGILYKYDFDRNSWYDREYKLAISLGGLQPYVVIREFPSQLTIGLQFRADELFERLTRRQMRR